jgi:hypothetical protein
MTKRDKKLAQMVNNPNGWQIEDLQSMASAHNIEWQHDGSSHVVFRDKDGAHLTVPANRPIKPVYIRRFVALIKKGAKWTNNP